jgi:hypothetical protein
MSDTGPIQPPGWGPPSADPITKQEVDAISGPADLRLGSWDPRDSEIERLRWWLEHILRSRTSAAIDLREMAHNALEGDAQGPPHQNRGP